MFNSGITTREIIDQINAEADIALEIPDQSYIDWLNALEQLLYSEIIKEQKKFKCSLPELSPIALDDIDVSTEESPVRFEDIHAIYADDTQLTKSTVASGEIFPNTFYKIDNKLAYNIRHHKEIEGVYHVRPKLKTRENTESTYVMLPIEFIDLAKAKLRGEAYKLANEDSLAAKWLNDYNILLETFKAWIAEKSSTFGM